MYSKMILTTTNKQKPLTRLAAQQLKAFLSKPLEVLPKRLPWQIALEVRELGRKLGTGYFSAAEALFSRGASFFWQSGQLTN